VLQVEIRRALPGEAANLSALALRSKALWGYNAAFMEACRAPLTVDPKALAKYPFYVLDEGGTITGFYGLSGQPPRGEIEFLFVEPERVRSGRGQRLVRHLLALARSLGFEEMDVSADPYAEDFYVAMGAVRTEPTILAFDVDRTPEEPAILTLARRHGLTVYDASYLELAERPAAPLATLDVTLARAAQRENISLIGQET
jgi:GNAT superfamily N-acetyltransferase